MSEQLWKPDFIDKLGTFLSKGMKVEVVGNTYVDDNTSNGSTLKIPEQTIYLNNPLIRLVDDDEVLEILSEVKISHQEPKDVQLYPLGLYTSYYVIDISEKDMFPLHLSYQVTTDEVFNEVYSPMFTIECYASPL